MCPIGHVYRVVYMFIFSRESQRCIRYFFLAGGNEHGGYSSAE